jgi:hypothetical protein
MRKEPGRCIFCGRHGLSKEHIWSEWTHEIVPRNPDGVHDRLVVNLRKKDSDHYRKTHQGSTSSIKIRKVCKSCNSGWMSRLDKAAKPLLLPLILENPVCLSPDALRFAATWIAMKLMVAEWSRPIDVATPQEERTFLMEHQEPPTSWKIWIASHSSEVWRTTYHRHSSRIGVAPKGVIPSVADRPATKNIQATTLGIGCLLVYAVSTRLPLDFELPSQVRGNAFPIWPIVGAVTWPPSRTLSQLEVETIALAMERSLSIAIPKSRWLE